jgi:hypothetical protein
MSAADQRGGLGALLRRGWRKVAGGGAAAAEPEPEVERRSSKRVELRLPVEACVEGGRFEQGELVDVSLRGVAVEPAEGVSVKPGEEMSLRLRSNAAGVQPFVLTGRIVRRLPSRSRALAVDVSGDRNSPETLASFRRLVLFYLRRKPLLAEINSGSFEGRCVSCEWTGRVARQSPECPACGQEVVRSRA